MVAVVDGDHVNDDPGSAGSVPRSFMDIASAPWAWHIDITPVEAEGSFVSRVSGGGNEPCGIAVDLRRVCTAAGLIGLVVAVALAWCSSNTRQPAARPASQRR
jgi:hypothetical protein